MDAPIRRYVRVEEGADGNREPVTTKRVRRKRKKPFAAEYALLAELGLRRDWIPLLSPAGLNHREHATPVGSMPPSTSSLPGG